MADLFSRLAERALGVAAVVRPVSPPVFAPTPQVAVGGFTPMPPSAIPPADERQPEPEAPQQLPEAPPQLPQAPPRVPTAEQALDAKDLRFAPWRKMPEPPSRGEDAYPTTKNQELRNTVGQASAPVAPQVSREPDSGLLETPGAEQRIGTATESSPMATTPFRRPSAETSATDPSARRMNPGSRGDDDAGGKAATLVDAPLWRRPATPALAPAPRASTKTATQERERVRGHEQSSSTVQVNIGRIEVRAVFPQPLTSSPVRRAADSALSLADYLKERDRGVR
jgi:hypothetical protein